MSPFQNTNAYPDTEDPTSSSFAASSPGTAILSRASASGTLARGEGLGRYLHEVSNWSLLSAEGEQVLGRQIAEGDPSALRELVERNLRLVVYWARRYCHAGLPIQDLIQEGNIGLIRAAKKFDFRRGTRFSTYASNAIRQAIIRATFDMKGLIRIPIHMHQKMRSVDHMLEDAGALSSNSVDVQATVEEMGIISFRDWDRTRRIKRSISLEPGLNEDRDYPSEIEDVQAVTPLHGVHLREVKDLVSKVLKALPPRHQLVLKLRYGLDGEVEHTIQIIADQLRISRERVRQIQADALQRLAVKMRVPQSDGSAPERRGKSRSLANLSLSGTRRILRHGTCATS
jgi:RNA polymerase sigma factor (sigma-70 family)